MELRTWIAVFAILAAGLTAASSLNDETEDALVNALADERSAAAFYQAVIDRLGDVRPFSNIVHAEIRHADHLLPLFERYGVKVPQDRSAERMPDVPDARSAACAVAVDAEIANIALYDRLLESVSQSDVREVFTRLREASLKRHLPAFRRCAESLGSGAECGCGARNSGHGRSRGRHGHGARQARCMDADESVATEESRGNDRTTDSSD
jgi:rubrerythrin